MIQFANMQYASGKVILLNQFYKEVLITQLLHNTQKMKNVCVFIQD